MKENKTRYFEINLGYFKKGDDLAHFLKETENNIPSALRLHADMLESDAQQLRTLADRLPAGTSLDAQTHHLGGEGPWDVVTSLIEEGLLGEDPFENEREGEEDE